MNLAAMLNPVRLYQRWRLRGTRLRRVLERRHVDVGTYLEATPFAEVEMHLARCAACQSAWTCDRTVVSLAASSSRYEFCPNVDVIDRFTDSAGLRLKHRHKGTR